MNFYGAILILKIEENMQHFQHIMLSYFKKGKNPTEMQKEICAVCGNGAVTDRTRHEWFVKFCAGDSLLSSAPRLGGPAEVDSD